ncbi:hypothetical protein [Streptomyces sp. NBC_01244]|uniref:hypothetical protein n=1 Tax=Streptomyces sp. NBC_01244 TaxID=2903797 RepID=UPI002E156427|nr:hypothetical protein OG247_24340 [Streptomyces sp. NBC_01244]
MSPEPIPKYIEQGALRRANARYQATLEARRDPESVVERIKAAAQAKQMKPKAYIDSLVKDKEKLVAPEGTHPISAFWSFGIEHPEAPPNNKGVHFLDQRFIAEEWAAQRNKANPGVAQTLETTEGGRELDDMFLWEDAVIGALGGAQKGFKPGYARECWGQISTSYAEVAEGRAVVFGQTAHTLSILHQEELRTLCANEKVGLDNIHFAYEAPRDWPAETRAEAGTDAVRAAAQFNDPTLPRYIDPKAFGADAPEARKAKIDKVLTAATPAQEAPVVAAPVGQAPPKSVRTPLWQVGFKSTPTAARPASRGPAAGTGTGAGTGPGVVPDLAPRPLTTGMDGMA